MVQEFVSRLRIAESDADVKGIVLKIDSGGGTVTGSDIIYHADFGVWWTVISE
jgi:protease-4